jgi:hypothetical protein
MNWIRENKFLTGFIAVLVIGAGALGYLLYTAYDAYSEVTDQYTQQASELHRLQSLVPYPDKQNLAKYAAELDDLKDATHDLATRLSSMELPVPDLSPSAFQDHLRDIVSAITAKANRTGVKLPDNFALDFQQYQSQPPPAAAAGPLGRQLDALNVAMNILLDEHVDALAELSRTKLPQEAGGGGGGSGGHGGEFGGGRGGSDRSGGDLVDKVSFLLKFTANQPAFQKVLNDFASSSQQYFITRTLLVENTDPKPVSKSADTSAPAPAPPGAAPASPDASGAGGAYLKFLVGTEKLNVTMQVDIVTFNPPDKSTRAGAASNHP